ncbi:MAG: hypothetical protein ABFD64_03360 [Armatimonadota bacterium]
MDEVDMLLAEAISFADDVIADLDRVSESEFPDDTKEAVHEALRLSEEMMNRLEDALDIVESDEDQSRIEMAIVNLEDAMDSGHLALTADDPAKDLEIMRLKAEEAIAQLSTYEESDE